MGGQKSKSLALALNASMYNEGGEEELVIHRFLNRTRVWCRQDVR